MNTTQQCEQFNLANAIEGRLCPSSSVVSPNILNPDTLWSEVEVESFGPAKLGKILTISRRLYLAVMDGNKLVCTTSKRDIDCARITFVKLEYIEAANPLSEHGPMCTRCAKSMDDCTCKVASNYFR